MALETCLEGVAAVKSPWGFSVYPLSLLLDEIPSGCPERSRARRFCAAKRTLEGEDSRATISRRERGSFRVSLSAPTKNPEFPFLMTQFRVLRTFREEAFSWNVKSFCGMCKLRETRQIKMRKKRKKRKIRRFTHTNAYTKCSQSKH